MYTFKAVVVIALAAGVASAAPSVSPRQDVVLLSLCNNPHQGDCLDFQASPGKCSNIPGGWNDNISSLTIGTQCIFYKNRNCDSSGGSITLGGTQDTLPADIDNQISSVKCCGSDFCIV